MMAEEFTPNFTAAPHIASPALVGLVVEQADRAGESSAGDGEPVGNGVQLDLLHSELGEQVRDAGFRMETLYDEGVIGTPTERRGNDFVEVTDIDAARAYAATQSGYEKRSTRGGSATVHDTDGGRVVVGSIHPDDVANDDSGERAFDASELTGVAVVLTDTAFVHTETSEQVWFETDTAELRDIVRAAGLDRAATVTVAEEYETERTRLLLDAFDGLDGVDAAAADRPGVGTTDSPSLLARLRDALGFRSRDPEPEWAIGDDERRAGGDDWTFVDVGDRAGATPRAIRAGDTVQFVDDAFDRAAVAAAVDGVEHVVTSAGVRSPAELIARTKAGGRSVDYATARAAAPEE